MSSILDTKDFVQHAHGKRIQRSRELDVKRRGKPVPISWVQQRYLYEHGKPVTLPTVSFLEDEA